MKRLEMAGRAVSNTRRTTAGSPRIGSGCPCGRAVFSSCWPSASATMIDAPGGRALRNRSACSRKAGQIAGPQGPRDGKPLQPGDRRLQLALDHERHAAGDLERALGGALAVRAVVQVRVGRREGDDRQHADDDEQRQPLAKRQALERPKAAAAAARDGDRTAHGGDMDLNSSLPERSGVTELHLCPCRGVRVSGAIVRRKRPLRAWQQLEATRPAGHPGRAQNVRARPMVPRCGCRRGRRSP